MSNEKRKKLHLIYGCVTALLLLGVAIGLIISCVTIYQSGDRPFNRDVIGQAFAKLAVPGWLSVVAIFGAFALHIMLPLEAVKPKAIRDDAYTLSRYSLKKNELASDDQRKVQIEIRRRQGWIVSTVVLAVLLAVYPVIYYCDLSNFGISDLNGDMLRAFLVVLVPAFITMSFLCITSWQCSASITREIAIYRSAGIKPGKTESAKADKNPTVVRIVIVAAAVILITMGIFNEGYVDVTGKAIKICTECIGLG